MPTLFRFLMVVGLFVGSIAGGLYVLAEYFQPEPKEISKALATSRCGPMRSLLAGLALFCRHLLPWSPVVVAKPWRRSSGASFPYCRAKLRRNPIKTLAFRQHRHRLIKTLGRNLRRPAIKTFRLRRRHLGRLPKLESELSSTVAS